MNRSELKPLDNPVKASLKKAWEQYTASCHGGDVLVKVNNHGEVLDAVYYDYTPVIPARGREIWKNITQFYVGCYSWRETLNRAKKIAWLYDGREID